MIHYRNNGIGIKLIRKKVTKEDHEERAIYWQITYKRKSVLYFTGRYFTAGEWDDILNKQLRKHNSIKETFQGYFDNTLRPLIDEFAINNTFTFEALNLKLTRGTDHLSVNNAFQKRIESGSLIFFFIIVE